MILPSPAPDLMSRYLLASNRARLTADAQRVWTTVLAATLGVDQWVWDMHHDRISRLAAVEVTAVGSSLNTLANLGMLTVSQRDLREAPHAPETVLRIVLCPLDEWRSTVWDLHLTPAQIAYRDVLARWRAERTDA